MTELKDYYFYIIYCKSNTNLSYIGKTTDIYNRKRKHKDDCYNRNKNIKIYQSIRENGGWDNWIMEEISYQKGLTDLEARVTEQILINDLGNLNEIKAYISKEDKQEYEKKYSKQYRETHKEQVQENKKEYDKKYRETHKEQAKQYREKNKEQFAEYKKEYYEKNKEKQQKIMKEYREKNAEKIKAQQKEKVSCECGCIVSRCELTTHRKTIKHLELFIKL